MNKLFKILVGLFIGLGVGSGVMTMTSCASAPQVNTPSAMTYNYARLKLLDLDQMSDLIQKRVQGYKRTDNEELMQEALELCLSRPDEDSMVEKLIDSVRFNASSEAAWEQWVEAAVEKSIAQLKNETTPAVDQVTYLILLENLIAQFRPEFLKQWEAPQFESEVIEKIAAAELVVSDAAVSERRLNLMETQRSPSRVAQDLIKEREQANTPPSRR
ncbi:hypothetical protein [Pseudobdellovibrio exovorus]|uniref:Lipoprotein n=1 Tax=Pseudobdellovibrio exovorus JSS TaxID=1184267 RepID=M4VA75_9BACT|nr:hypothetical protein [Pseudobdellovibrio exovorus]AGH94926.1 hypothetical protein A11Q_706 [Pseudobdellovibrio exovorus JSS]